MRIAVVGAGGVGGYFGARLAQAGEDVGFIARGAHLAAMRERGLTVLSANGDVTVHPVDATDDPATIGPVDIVMFCVKLWDTDAVAARLQPLLGEHSAVISFQNGVYAEPRLAEVVGAKHVMGGVASILAGIREPGVIVHTGTMAWLEFGELDGRRSERAEAFLAACQRAGVEARIPEDITAAIWHKFVLLSSLSAATCLARAPIGPIRRNEQGRRLIETLLEEAAAVARLKASALPADVEAQCMRIADGMPEEAKASMLNDLEQGRRLEVDWLSGTVARLGSELRVATPAHRTAWQALSLHAAGAARAS